MQGGNNSGGESTDSAFSSKTENPFEPESPVSKKASSSDNNNQQQLQFQQDMASDATRGAASLSQNESAAKSTQEKVNHKPSLPFHC